MPKDSELGATVGSATLKAVHETVSGYLHAGISASTRGCCHITLAQIAKARIWQIARYAAAVFA